MKPPVIKYYHQPLIQSSEQRILEVLFKYPDKEYSLSDLAKCGKVAKQNIKIILNHLNKDNFIKIEKLANIWRIKANRENEKFIRSKIIYNLNFIYQSGIIEFLNSYFNNPKAIVLFGSFRKGEDITGSDIDIAIETDVKEYQTIGLRELVDFEKLIGRKIQLHLFNRENIDKYLFNNVANGIVLAGFLEVNI